MSTAAKPHCRQVFRTPTFVKSLDELKIGPKEADDITHFVGVNAQSGTIEHRQLGFVLKRLPWKPQLWVQFLEDDVNNVYLLTMTDEEMGPRPPTKRARLARIIDRLWVAAAVRGAEWLAHVLLRLTLTGHVPSIQRLKSMSLVALTCDGVSGDAGTARPSAGSRGFDSTCPPRFIAHPALSTGGIVGEYVNPHSKARYSESKFAGLQARLYRADVSSMLANMLTCNQMGRDINTDFDGPQVDSQRSLIKSDSNH